jgi:hypothetical protein
VNHFGCVAGQPTDQVQQGRAFCQIERCAEADIVAADVQAQRNLFRRLVRQELVQQMAGGQGDGVEVGAVPAVEQDAAAAGILDDGVQTIAQLVDRLVQQHLVRALILDDADSRESRAPAHAESVQLVVCLDQFVGRPRAPLHAIHRAQIVFFQAIRIGQPFDVFIGVLIPHLAAECAEVRCTAGCAQEADQFAD